MSLAPGTRLGVYEITALIGAGGMGQVYRARDARLNRDVAIKVLPDLFASDPDRLARFEREAQVLASLNHPHIASIYGLEDSNGIRALALELVEGPTLAARIAEGPIAYDEALPIARQIVDALEAAHEKGIVHRDLKPANIKLRPDGTVKVLDFGLAKVFEAGQPVPVNLSMSPTLTGPIASQAGVIMGTAAYMSPEQARGRAVDHRSDVWAFGCVLYEMLAGKPAFIGTDVTEILASVIKSDPDLAALSATVTPRVRVVVQRCLQKDTKLRFQHIGDIRLALDGAFETATPSVSNGAGGRSRRRHAAMLAVAIGVAATIAAAATWGVMRSRLAAAKPVTRFSLQLPENAQWVSNTLQSFAISRDGRRIVYMTQLGTGRQLYVHGFDQLDPIAIRSSAGLLPSGSIFLSPDGESVGFNDPEGGTFKKLAVNGGPLITISRTAGMAGGFRGASWGPSGTIAFSTGETSGVMLLPEDGGDVTPLTIAAEGETHWFPHFLPDGRSLLYEIRRGPQRQIAVIDVDSRETRLLLKDASSPRFVSSGHLLFLREGTIWAVAFDRARLELIGDPVPVLEGVTITTSGYPWFDVAADGTLVFSPGASVRLRNLVLVDRQGRERQLEAPPRAYIQARFSPDGTRIALTADDGDRDVWIWDGQRLSRFTLEQRRDGFPVWSLPDGRRLAFASERAGNEPSIYEHASDLTGSVTRLTNSPGGQLPNSFTPDGKYLVFVDNAVSNTTADLKMLEVGNPAHTETLVATPGADFNGDVSPTGRWLAYQSNEAGTNEVYVRPFPNVNDGRWQISTAGGTRPRWSKTGRELFYLDAAGRLMSITVNVNSQRDFSHGPPVRVLERTYYVSMGANYDVAPDGKTFVMIKEGTDATGSQRLHLNAVLNWTEELKRLARPR